MYSERLLLPVGIFEIPGAFLDLLQFSVDFISPTTVADADGEIKWRWDEPRVIVRRVVGGVSLEKGEESLPEPLNHQLVLHLGAGKGFAG